MKNLILATASVLALGIAGSGIGNAADNYNSSPNTPGASTQTPSATTMPQSTQAVAVTAPVNASESQVKQAQERLKSAGLYKGTADGKMGAETKQAISEFQQQHGLTKTGTLDQETLAALNSNQSSGRSSVSGSTTQPSSSGAAGSLNPSTAPSSR
jgi:peptidoglycan hydrolase-like protein with peptidoglycan-binding domain